MTDEPSAAPGEPDWKHAFAVQSRKLQAVLHIPGVRESLAELKFSPPRASQPQGELLEGMVLVPRATAAKLIDALHWWDIRPDVKNQNRVIDAARSIAALAGRTAS